MATFISPMLASPLRPGFVPRPGEYHAEEKFDGIRLIVDVNHEVPEDLLTDCTVTSWSRDGILHAIPRHLRDAFAKLPTAIYDCELYVPGKRSYGATRLDQSDKLQIAVFDILRLGEHDTTTQPLMLRRKILAEMFAHPHVASVASHVALAEARIIHSFEDVISFRDEVWARDGEGLILKALAAPYRPGKRDKTWIKIKQLKSAALTCVGFAASFGEIENRGPFAMVVLRDEQGVITSVKTRNNAWLTKLAEEHNGAASEYVPMRIGPRTMQVNTRHPRVGTLLRIEYQEQTPDGSYRHPRWDRFENE